MPTLRSGTSTNDTGVLTTVDEHGNFVDLPTEEAIDNLPLLYDFKRQLQEKIKSLQIEVGRKLRVNLDPDPSKTKEIYAQIEEGRLLDDQRIECEQTLLKVQMALQQTEFVISQEEETTKREKEMRMRREKADRRRAEREAEERESNKRKEHTTVTDRLTEYEARLARTEQLMAELLSMPSQTKGNRNGNESRKKEDRRSSRDSSRSTDRRSNGSSRSPSPVLSRKRQDKPRSYAEAVKGEEFFKVPELLPIFRSESEDPEAFVDDFNAVLECIDEASATKTVLWFKSRVRIPASNWDAGLSPRKESLRAYQRAFLKYYWSTSAQRLAVENFERARLNFKSEISVSRQILNFYSKMKRVRAEPMPDSKFKREIVRKLPQALRGHFIWDQERSITEFAAKVAELLAETGHSSEYNSRDGREYNPRNARRYSGKRRSPRGDGRRSSPNTSDSDSGGRRNRTYRRDNYRRDHRPRNNAQSWYNPQTRPKWDYTRDRRYAPSQTNYYHNDNNGHKGETHGLDDRKRTNRTYNTREFRRSPPPETKKVTLLSRRNSKMSDGSDNGRASGSETAKPSGSRKLCKKDASDSDSGNE